jgi:hypothetical protein
VRLVGYLIRNTRRTFGRLRGINVANSFLLRHDKRFELHQWNRKAFITNVDLLLMFRCYKELLSLLNTQNSLWQPDEPTPVSIWFKCYVLILDWNHACKWGLAAFRLNKQRWRAGYMEQLAGPQSLGRLIDWLHSFTYYSCVLRLRITTDERFRVQSGLMGIWRMAWIVHTVHQQRIVFLYDRRMLHGNLEAFILKRKKIQFVEIFLSRRHEQSGAVSEGHSVGCFTPCQEIRAYGILSRYSLINVKNKMSFNETSTDTRFSWKT